MSQPDLREMAMKAMKLAMEVIEEVSDENVTSSSKVVAAAAIMPSLMMIEAGGEIEES